MQLSTHITHRVRPGARPRQPAPPRPAPGSKALCRASPEEGGTPVLSTVQASPEAPEANGNGASPTIAAAPAPSPPLEVDPEQLSLTYQAPSGGDQFWTNFRLAFALPWRRFPKASVLTIKLEGEVSDQTKSWLEPGVSIPQVCRALQKGALDPRVAGLAIEVGPLSLGYAKLQEIRRHLDYFRASGKFTIAYIKQGGEKEYYLASACKEVYVPPTGNLFLRGFVVGGSFLRGVLDKIGVEPQVQRYGQYKSAGDQLLRRDMAPAQREQLQAILDDTYADFVSTVAAARGKTTDEVQALLDAGLYEPEDLLKGGWIDGLKYEDELIEDIKKRQGVAEDKLTKPLKKVGVRKLDSVRAGTYPALAGGRKRIVVLRTSGAILGRAAGTGGSITPDVLIPRLRALALDKSVAAVVLRVDSPGGDALASDLMWREVKKLGEKKPVIASMGDVAASGGYYISMGARAIVAEPLTVTGSIGVVTAKFSLAELYGKIGFTKELLSKGRYAELLADNRPFTEDELSLFERSALSAYESFRNKAAESRGMDVDAMQAVAQGRVWTGRAALERGLVDALGGVHAAVQLARAAAGIKADERVTILDVGTASTSPLALLRGATVAAMLPSLSSASPSTGALTPLAMLGALAAVVLAPTGAVAPLLPAAMDVAAGDALLQVQAALGSELAGALAAARGVLQGGSGIALCVEPEVLAVQAAGTRAAAGGAVGTAQSDDTFLFEP